MKTPTIKFSLVNNEVEEVPVSEVKVHASKRIDEERLFHYFTADIIKMKVKFTR